MQTRSSCASARARVRRRRRRRQPTLPPPPPHHHAHPESPHKYQVPNISRQEYTLVDINDEGFVTLMLENGDTREDLALPKGTDEAEKLSDTLKEQFAAGTEVVVGVLKAMGEEMINSVKIVNAPA